MRNCDEILDLISASLDGALTTEEQTTLDVHLASCPACSALYTELCGLHTAAAELEELPAPAGFAEAVMAAIAAQPAQDQSDNVIPFSAKRKTRALWTKWAATAAAVAIVVLGAVSIPSLSGNMEVKRDAAAPQAPGAPQAYQNETADIAESEAESYYTCDTAPAESGVVLYTPEAPVPEAAPEEANMTTAATPSSKQDFSASNALCDAADYCGTLTLTSDMQPEGLEQYESTVAPDGTVTYVVPADYFFSVVQTLENSGDTSFRYNATQDDGGVAYGLILIEAHP